VRITAVDQLHADGGWRTFSFLRLSTDEGAVGWTEYNEAGWNRGLSAVIRALAPNVIGRDPSAYAAIGASLRAATALAPGGISEQAIAAIQNACLDLAGKAAGLPVHALLGGPHRARVRAYWSHCGSFRVRHAERFARLLGTPPLRSLNDVEALGREAVGRGYRAAKLNPVLFGPDGARLINPGFEPDHDAGGLPLAPIADASVAQVEAFRRGAGTGVDVLLDVNFAVRPADLRVLARRLEPLGLLWLEADGADAAELARARSGSATPIGSLETMHGLRAYRPYLEAGAVDVAIVDPTWNGVAECVRIATLADAFGIEIAPHNFYGPLATLASLHLCAAVPNVRITEVEGDDVPWRDELVTAPARLEDGDLLVPAGPGWGADVNEAAVRRHPADAPS
jgi:L-alanine-DL-glutamate epimerase-like enolase superfamily enzyme